MRRFIKRLGTLIRLRARRQYYIARALVRGRRMTSLRDRTAQIAPNAILALVTLRNERVRLPYFLDY